MTKCTKPIGLLKLLKKNVFICVKCLFPKAKICHILAARLLMQQTSALWWPCRFPRNAKQQIPPGPEGSNGSCDACAEGELTRSPPIFFSYKAST
jgi:hypothetical protein